MKGLCYCQFRQKNYFKSIVVGEAQRQNLFKKCIIHLYCEIIPISEWNNEKGSMKFQNIKTLHQNDEVIIWAVCKIVLMI